MSIPFARCHVGYCFLSMFETNHITCRRHIILAVCISISLKVFPFAVDGIWQPWSDWGDCPVTCGGAEHSRNRTCFGPFYDGANCSGPATETRDCNTQHCPGQICMGQRHKTVITHRKHILHLPT